MARTKKTYRTVEKAELRAAGLTAIDPNLDFGEERSISQMNHMIETLRNAITAHNTALSTIDSSQLIIKEYTEKLKSLNEKMLIGVAHVYGTDSKEYEMAGGTRKSVRIQKMRNARQQKNNKPAENPPEQDSNESQA